MSNYFDLKDVYFYYTSIQDPRQKYQTTGPTEKEYSVTLIVSKEQQKEFVGKYPAKKVAPLDSDEFEAQYKTKPPFPGPLQYIIKLQQKAFKADGSPMPDSLKPKVMQFIDGVQTDVTATTLVGNGSKGTARYLEWEPLGQSKAETTAKLYAILVDTLIPYEKKTNSANVF
jgi:hypothetical protein